MLRQKLIVLLSCVLIPLSVSAASAADTGYFSVKGGLFLPNGSAGSGLKTFDTGYSTELAIGFRPDTYAALEIGTGFFSASGTVTDADSKSVKRIYSVPVTATAKAILDLEKFELFCGAGVGYYFAFVDNKTDFYTGGIAPVDESSHGNALGYHAVLGGDYKVSENFRLGADFKWFVAKPELELTSAQNVKTRTKWDIGGTVMNLGLKYLY